MNQRGRTTARRLMQSIFASEWYIRPEWLQQFAGIAQRCGEDSAGALTAESIRIEIRRALAELNAGHEEAKKEALAYQTGQLLRDGSKATVRDGVAIVPVIGPLFHYASEFDDVCGCSSYEQIARDIAAVRDSRSALHSVLFNFDTPGGEVAGCAETADMIRQLAEEMPVHGYVADLGCSAGYYLAAATSRIIGARASITGSIGVVATYRAKNPNGPQIIEIVSSQSPKKRPDVESAEGRAQIQSVVDALAEVFVADVARYRGVSVEKVLADFGQGDVLVGQNAIDAGLIDELGSFEGVLSKLTEHKGASSRGAFNSQHREAEMPDTNAPANADKPAITREYLDANHADLVAAIHAEGAAEGKTSERERILGIEKLAIKGHEKLIGEMKADASVSVEQAALRIVQAEQTAGGRMFDRMRADEEDLKEKPGASTGADTDSEEAVAKRVAGHSKQSQQK